MKANASLHERNPMRAVRGEYIRWTAYGLLLLAAFLLQNAPHALSVGGAKPMLLLLLVVDIALFVGPLGGGIAGAAAGFLWDIFSTRLPGFHGLCLLVIGCTCGLLIWMLLRNNVLTAWMLSAGALAVQILLDWGIHVCLLGKPDPFLTLWTLYLPSALYSLLLAPLTYWLVAAVARFLHRHE